MLLTLGWPSLYLRRKCARLVLMFKLLHNLLTVLGSLLLKSNSLHITLYFEEGLCITVTYYLEIKVTSNILD